MRISTNMIFELGSTKISSLQSTLSKTQLQISSQRRILTPADDPIASASMLSIDQSMSLNDQFATNRQTAKNALQQQDSILGSVTDLLTDVKEMIIAAGNGVMEDEQRQYLAAGLRGRFEELLGLANSRDGVGNFMFGGYQISSQPFSQVPTGAQYSGDQGTRSLQISTSRQIPLNDSGSAIFEHIKTGNGTFMTAPAVANSGSGIVSSGAVVDATQIKGHTYSLAFSSYSSGASTSDTVSYAVIDTTNNTHWDGAAWVAGLPPAPPTAGTPVVAGWKQYVSDQAIAFDGLQLEVKGTPANGDAFSIKPSANQSIFSTLSKLLTTLSTSGKGANGQANLTNGFSAANDNIDNTLDNILGIRASIGTRLNEIDVLDATGEDLNAQYTDALNHLEDFDFAAAISNFTQQSMTLEAAQKSFTQISRLSLFNYI
jgi:flagellar hook-associated protein 3 FlgL